jgi:multidrug resistance efflux pump
VNLKKSEFDIKRAEKLLKTQAISQERYDQAKTSYDTACARLKTVEEGLHQTRANIEVQKRRQ